MGSASSVPAHYDEPSRGIIVTLIVLTTVAVASRFFSRRLQRAKTSLDDYLVGVAYLTNLALLITVLLEINAGAMSLPRMASMTMKDQLYMIDVMTVMGFLYTFAIIFVKVSVLLLYRRIFTLQEKWFQIFWWANLILLVPCYITTALTLTGLQLSMSNSNKWGKNNLSRYGSLVLGIVNAVSDMAVLILPVAMVWRLIMSKRERVAIVGIFALGLVASAISITRVILFQVKRQQKWNPAYATYTDLMTTSSETSAGLICVCLIVIKPLLRKTRDVVISSAASMSHLVHSRQISPSNSQVKASNVSSVKSDRTSLQSGKAGEKMAVKDMYDLELNIIDSDGNHRVI